jgi:hypothetical protein
VLLCETVAWRGVAQCSVGARLVQASVARSIHSSEDDKVSRLRLRFTMLRCCGYGNGTRPDEEAATAGGKRGETKASAASASGVGR